MICFGFEVMLGLDPDIRNPQKSGGDASSSPHKYFNCSFHRIFNRSSDTYIAYDNNKKCLIADGINSVFEFFVCTMKYLLLITDDKFNQKLFAKILSKRGIESDSAFDGTEVLRIINENFDKYNIIFLDNLMQTMVNKIFISNKLIMKYVLSLGWS